MRAKTCSECGLGFEAPRSFQLTCGDACSLTRKRRMKREGYHHNTPHRRMQIAAISAARRQRIKNAPPVYQSCAVCKARYQRRRHNQKTCGPDCSKVYVRRQNTLYQRSVKAGIRAAKAEMLRAARKALAEGVIPRECLWCGDDFDAIDESELHCSEDCQVEDACERMKEAR